MRNASRWMWPALAALALASWSCAGSYSTVRARHAPPHRHYGHERVTTVVFYDELSPHGRWFEYGSHGWVWAPYDVPYGWRPYSRGYWVYTDWGWTWVSHERWGWACEHYGRWTYEPRHGWFWVPGRVWAPAWVAWRYGNGWAGWTPLPPAVRWDAGIGIRADAYDFDRIAPERWCFVEQRALLSRDLSHRIVPAARGVTHLGRTKNVTRFEAHEARPAERGLRPEWIEKVTGTRMSRARIEDADSPDDRRGLWGGAIRTFRPNIEDRPDISPVTRGALPVPMPVEPAREEAERRRLDSHLRREREQLEWQQRQELRQLPPGERRQEVRERHREEQRVLDEQARREREQVEGRARRAGEKQRRKTEREEETPARPKRGAEPGGG